MTFEQWFRNEVSEGRLYGSDEEAAEHAWKAAERATLQTLLPKVESILDGIDRQETDRPEGWWETSGGADFGFDKLEKIREIMGKTGE